MKNKDFSKLINNPIYKQKVKDWEYARSEAFNATQKEDRLWKEILEMERKFKEENDISDN